MSDMVERAARAYCVAEGVDPDKDCAGLGNLVPVGETWPAWKVRVVPIRAAIAAMREPTEPMIDVAWKMLAGNLRPNEYYKYMIYTALQENKP